MARFQIDPQIDFLNHGSFGAVPVEVEVVQRALQAELESEPVRFMMRRLPGLLETALERAARFVGTTPDGLAFVRNATAGANAVLASLELAPGDEVLTTDHRYNAVCNAMRHVAARAGAVVSEVSIPFPLPDPGEILRRIEAALGPRTRLLVIDQITSPTALCFPVAEILAAARTRGIPVLVDGAHAPGQLDLDLDTLDPDFWVGNLHKWVCAPRGTALLRVSERWRTQVHPTVISHGYGQGFQAEFSWTGTDDPTGWLAAPAAMDLHETLGGADFRAAGHALVRDGRRTLAEALDVPLPHPDDPALYAMMATVPLDLPDWVCQPLMDALLLEHHIEVPVVPFGGKAFVRISGFPAYNHAGQYERLAAVLADLSPHFRSRSAP